MISNFQIVSLVVVAIIILGITFRIAQGKYGCPSCHRLFAFNETQQTFLRNRVQRNFTERGVVNPFVKEKFRAWEDWTEKNYKVYRFDYTCKKCGHTWQEDREKLDQVNKFKREIPPDQYHFPH